MLSWSDLVLMVLCGVLFLFPCPIFQCLTMKVLDASLPVPDINEDDLKHDAAPQEALQPEAVAAPQELDRQQPEVASPLQEPPREQAETPGTNGRC